MNPIVMQLKCDLAQGKKDFDECKIKILRIIHELQSNLNPYFGDDIEKIKAQEIEQAADELLDFCNKAVELKTKIKKMEADLG